MPIYVSKTVLGGAKPAMQLGKKVGCQDLKLL